MNKHTTTETFYKEVITKVLDQSRDYFLQSNVNEDVLVELKKLWCEKLTNSGIFNSHNRSMGYNKYGSDNINNVYNRNDYGSSFIHFKSEKDKTTNDNIALFKSRLLNRKNIFNENNNFNENVINTKLNKVNNFSDDENIKKDIDQDSDEEAFKKKDEINTNTINEEEGEELSELTAESIRDDIEGKDFLYAQYDKVHRVKSKWKCSFKDAILQINGKEYIFEKVIGELERHW